MYIKRFFLQSYLSFKALFGWAEPKTYILIKIINPILQLCFFCLLARFAYGDIDLTNFVIGNSIILCSYNCVFGIGTVFIQERYFGTLKVIVASPSNNLMNFIERGVIHVFDSLITVVVSLITGALLFNADFSNISMLNFSIIIFAGIFSACCFGLFMGSFGMVTGNINMVLNIVSMMFLVFTGANYPVELLHPLFRIISKILPLTRTISLGKALINGELMINNIHLLIGEMLVGVFYAFIGYFFLRITERVAQVLGTLDLY